MWERFRIEFFYNGATGGYVSDKSVETYRLYSLNANPGKWIGRIGRFRPIRPINPEELALKLYSRQNRQEGRGPVAIHRSGRERLSKRMEL